MNQEISEEQHLKILIQRWLIVTGEATTYTDLTVGKHVIKEVDGISYFFFKSRPLLNYLREEYKRLTAEDLWIFIDKWGGIHHYIRIKTPTLSIPTSLWGIPISFIDEELEREKNTAILEAEWIIKHANKDK